MLNGTQISELSEKIASLAEQAKTLQAQLRRSVARGTQHDIKPMRARSTTQPPLRSRPVTQPPPTNFVGDEGPTSELYAAVLRLIRERPQTLPQLIELTGARPNRIKGVLMRIQKDLADRGTLNLCNLGDDRKALWFVPDVKLLERLRRIPGFGS